MTSTGKPLDPAKVVASFDSASVMHAANVAALQGRPFPHLGNPEIAARAVRLAGHLPWPLLRQVYARIGGAEGVPVDRLERVDLAAVARSFTAAIPVRPYPAVMIGSSNGALLHLAAAMQVPWLPNTVLVPVARTADPARVDQALDFGRRVGPKLLTGNEDVVLHQMHDAAQDELMVARMAYFRVKWTALPDAYAEFCGQNLAPGAPIFLAHDASSWPVVRVAERHVFQHGGRGGLTPQEYEELPHAPQPDDIAPEAEWSAEPRFSEAVQAWGQANGHPVIRLSYDGPQQAAHPVATLFRRWYAERGEVTDRLIVPSFMLLDPWTTINAAHVPYWGYFAVHEALDGLVRHLAAVEPYREVALMLFQHGVSAPGSAGIQEWQAAVEASGARCTVIGVDPSKSPHDIGSLGRYGAELRRLPRARRPWSPLDPAHATAMLGEEPTLEGPTLLTGGV